MATSEGMQVTTLNFTLLASERSGFFTCHLGFTSRCASTGLLKTAPPPSASFVSPSLEQLRRHAPAMGLRSFQTLAACILLVMLPRTLLYKPKLSHACRPPGSAQAMNLCIGTMGPLQGRCRCLTYNKAPSIISAQDALASSNNLRSFKCLAGHDRKSATIMGAI